MVQATHIPLAGESIIIRPIRKSDTELESAFIRGLSPQTKSFRFLGGVGELAPQEVARLCDVDGKQAVAFVATVLRNGKERQIGVSRYAPTDEADVREIAVTVADEWQHSGLGAELLNRLIESARRNRVRRLYSVEVAENAAMAALARQAGMSAARDPDYPSQTIYSLAL